ncbi:MAG: DUF362 domain-containing protein [Coriobacteriia bacterium]|nr:DUF362 domain-containing protein [Coriobacteriia bacterium]
MTRSQVALVRCESYDPKAVDEAIGRALDLLGGAGRFARPGERLLLKPNLLVASKPADAVTTHPAVFEAVIRHLQAAGATLTYGDSPAFGKAEGAARRGGLAEVAERYDVAFKEFTEGRQVSFPDGGLIKQFTLAAPVLDADGIVSLSKLKTHGLTRMTGAVKNQFGCIPGVLKGEFHARMPDVERFSQMLVDLTAVIAPRLFVMDGILGMEGNGPRGGDPRMMNVIIASEDPVALDATVCAMVKLDSRLVPTVRWGAEWGLGNAEDIEYLGDALETFVVEDFVVNRSTGSTTTTQGRFGALVKDWVVPRPVIDTSRCTSCGTCVQMCPIDPKAVDFDSELGHAVPPVYHYERCIRCYCCQELCPEHAITVKTPILGRLIHRR